MSQVTHMNESCYTCEGIHVTYMDVSCHRRGDQTPPSPDPPLSAARVLFRFLPHTLFGTPFPLPSMATNRSIRRHPCLICVCVCVFARVCVSPCVRCVYVCVRVRVCTFDWPLVALFANLYLLRIYVCVCMCVCVYVCSGPSVTLFADLHTRGVSCLMIM